MSSDIKDVLLNPCGDVKIENGDLVLCTGADQIRQSWLIHMRTIKGEMITNVGGGVPWFGDEGEGILQKWNDEFVRVKQIMAEETLKVPGVLRVNGVEVDEVDKANRIYSITVDAAIEGDDHFVFDYQGGLPIGSCLATGAEDFPTTVDGLRIWFDGQDLANMIYQPSVPYFRLENKAGPGYALGAGPGPDELIDGNMEVVWSTSNVVTDGDMEAADGPEQVTDGDMEDPGTSAWTPGNSATLSKQTGTPHGGSQCLRIAYNGTTNPQAYQSNIFSVGTVYRVTGWARGDGSEVPRIYMTGTGNIWVGTSSTNWQYFEFGVKATNAALIIQSSASSAGYVEFDDVSVKESCPDWTIRNDAIIFKSTADPHGGTKALRVEYNGTTNPGAYQSVLTFNWGHRVQGWARGDGSSPPRVRDGTITLWTGTSSTSWQPFDLGFVASSNTQLRLECETSGAGWAEFDDIIVYKQSQDWKPENKGALEKVIGGAYQGRQSLRVTYAGTAEPYAYQSIDSGKDYTIKGVARGDGVNGFPRIEKGSTLLWNGTNSASWQEFEVTFSKGASLIKLIGPDEAGHADFDDLTLKEGGTGFPTLVGVSPINTKRSIYFNVTSENKNRDRFEFFDTPAIRHSTNEMTIFIVGKGSSTIMGFLGQNDAGTEKEDINIYREPPESGPGMVMKIASNGTAVAKALSDATYPDDLADPYYETYILNDGDKAQFYHNTDYALGDNDLDARKLIGDGYIGAEVSISDNISPNVSYDGFIGEILVYEGVLSSTDITAINAWLAQKWGF